MNELVRQAQPQIAAICDALVLNALCVVGKRMVRSDRSRAAQWCENTYATVYQHPEWRISESERRRTLKGAWEMAPWLFHVHAKMGNETASKIVYELDHYVADLVITKQPHRFEVLLHRLHAAGLDLEVPENVDPSLTLS